LAACGESGWLSVSVSEQAALFQIAARRDRDAAIALLGEQPTGTIVSDRYAVYLFIDDTQRQLCLAHVLRDFTALGERDGAPGRLGRELTKTLSEVFKTLNQPGREQALWTFTTTPGCFASELAIEVATFFNLILGGCGGHGPGGCDDGERQVAQAAQLSPEEKWEIFLEVASQEISQADAARKYGVDVSVIIRLRALAKDASLAALASARPGRPVSMEAVELELLRPENDRLSEAIKELALELSLHRGLSDAPDYLQWSWFPRSGRGWSSLHFG
jgi:transposase-like protein